jgi:hypothetical protein
MEDYELSSSDMWQVEEHQDCPTYYGFFSMNKKVA